MMKSDVVIESIIQSYDPVEKGFKIGKGHVKLTVRDFELVFGFVSGREPIVLKPTNKPLSPFADRRKVFKEKNLISVYEIADEIPVLVHGKTKNNVHDFVKLLCLHTMCSLFDANTGGNIKNILLCIVDDLEHMRKYAWSTFFLEKLVSSLDDRYTRPSTVIGCVSLILYLICEHTKLVVPKNPDALPRFCKWKLKRLWDAINPKLSLSKVPQSKLMLGTLNVTHTESLKYEIDEAHREDDVLYLKCGEAVEKEYMEEPETVVADEKNLVVNELEETNKELVKKVNELEGASKDFVTVSTKDIIVFSFI